MWLGWSSENTPKETVNSREEAVVIADDWVKHTTNIKAVRDQLKKLRDLTEDENYYEADECLNKILGILEHNVFIFVRTWQKTPDSEGKILHKVIYIKDHVFIRNEIDWLKMHLRGVRASNTKYDQINNHVDGAEASFNILHGKILKTY